MLAKFQVKTTAQNQMIDITAQIKKIIIQSGVENAVCTIFIPHTTAAITLNENSNPNVNLDMVDELNTLVPHRNYYRHNEGNSDAHLKASIIGATETIIISNGSPVFGMWQSIYLWEFDGPRTRTVYVKLQKDL